MGWQLGRLPGMPSGFDPVPMFTDWTNLAALPTGWTSSFSPVYFTTGTRFTISGFATSDEPTPNWTDQAGDGGQTIIFHVYIPAPTTTGGNIGSYSTTIGASRRLNLSLSPGYAATSAYGFPIYGNGFFRDDLIGNSEITTPISTPVTTGVQHLWGAGVARPGALQRQLYLSNGTGVGSLTAGSVTGPGPNVQGQRVDVTPTTQLCHTYAIRGALSLAAIQSVWTSLMAHP